MRSLCLRPIPVLLTLASLTLAACDEATDPTVTGPGKSLPSVAAPSPITSCGTVITQPGVYVMAADFSYCHQPVIDIRASDVTILGGHHRVDGNDAACITASNSARVRLDGVDLRHCDGGAIVFHNVSWSVVEHATIWFNPVGFRLEGLGYQRDLSSGDTVRSNSFYDNGEIRANVGPLFTFSDNTIESSGTEEVACAVILTGDVQDAVIRRNTFRGPCTLEVTGNRSTVASNTLDGNNLKGISQVAIGNGGYSNLIIDNRIRGYSTGIQEWGRYSTIRRNTVENGGTGIEEKGRDNVINGNTVQGNQGDGIAVSPYGPGTRINGNRVLNNGKAGIHVLHRLSYARGNVGAVIAENTALNNSGFDLLSDQECGSNTWRRNVFGTASAPCIH